MTARIAAAPGSCPAWCDGGHDQEEDFDDTSPLHNGTIAAPIVGTDRSAVVFVDSFGEATPTIAVAMDRAYYEDGPVGRFEGIPDVLTLAEATALARALGEIAALLAGTVVR